MSGRMSRNKGEELLVWKPVVGHPHYEVSSFGHVRRATPAITRKAGHMLKGSISHGYIKYKIATPEGKRVFLAHRLVCASFNGPAPSEKHEVAHNDGNRSNNHYTNLRWATRKENHADMQLHGTAVKGERNGRARLNAEQVMCIRQKYTGKHGQVAQFAREYGLSHSAMLSVVKGGNWSHV